MTQGASPSFHLSAITITAKALPALRLQRGAVFHPHLLAVVLAGVGPLVHTH